MELLTIQELGTVFFGIAVIHTFSIKIFQHLATHYPEGSIGENLFHLLGEVEIVFGFWAGLLILCFALTQGPQGAIRFVDGVNFTEPLFVFAIMTVASTRPVLDLALILIRAVARVLPLSEEQGFYLACLSVGPLLGSLITEPAAMTVTALLLRDRYYSQKCSDRFKYFTLGILFVNVSIGGVLTPFAAPPVIMVAHKWNWNLAFMAGEFGWKAMSAVLINSGVALFWFRKELKKFKPVRVEGRKKISPIWLQGLHLVFLLFIVLTSHHSSVFLGIFLFFLGVTTITKEYQDELELRQSLLVAFFLGGLVVLGSFQSWWLDPMIRRLDALPLFLGTSALTAITDNAALTFLGSQIPDLSPNLQYALVAGAVAGGGLTVIANAPNPAGFSILRDSFGVEGINPLRLLWSAALPTIIAMACFWLLPSL